MDLNIVVRNSKESVGSSNILDRVKTAFKLGYEVVALNTILEESTFDSKEIHIPEPLKVAIGENEKAEIQIGIRNYKILNRLTVVVGDNYHVHRLMKSPVTKKYDLIALQPSNFKIFQHICGLLDYDIMTFDLSSKMPYHFKHNNCRQAIQNGIVFEIQYSPCLRSSTERTLIISNANNLVDVVKGKKIILTSASLKSMELRSPKDVSNLGLLFGMSKEQSNASVRENCRGAIIHSEVRNKTGLGVVSIENLSEVAGSEKWLKEACTYLTTLQDNNDEPAKKLIKLETTK